MSLPFLLEIGTEEIPDWMIVPALNQLAGMFQALLDQHALGGLVKSVKATPRRLVLRADGLIDRQPDTEELVLGPPKSAGAGRRRRIREKDGHNARSAWHPNDAPKASTMFLQNEPKARRPPRFWRANCPI